MNTKRTSFLTSSDIAAIKFQSECTLVRAVCRMQPYVLCHDKRPENFCCEFFTRNIAFPYLKTVNEFNAQHVIIIINLICLIVVPLTIAVEHTDYSLKCTYM